MVMTDKPRWEYWVSLPTVSDRRKGPKGCQGGAGVSMEVLRGWAPVVGGSGLSDVLRLCSRLTCLCSESLCSYGTHTSFLQKTSLSWGSLGEPLRPE